MTQNNEKRKEISQRLKEEREYRGFSKQEIAEHLDISQTDVAEIESGQQEIDSEILQQMANLYNITIERLRDNLNDNNTDEEIELLTRSNKELSKKDRNEIHRFANFLKSRQDSGGSDD